MNSSSADLVEQIRSIGSVIGVEVDTALVDDRDGWIAVDRLFSADDRSVTTFIDRVAAVRDTQDRVVAAMLAWKQYSYLCAQLVIGSWAGLGCVPDLRRANASVRFDPTTGSPSIAMREPLVFVAAGDERASLDIAEPVLPEELDELVLAVWWSEHMRPMIDRWRCEARLARRGLTAFAVSQATNIVSRADGGDCAARHSAIERWRRLLPDSMRSMSPVVEVRHDDAWLPMPLRTSCCLQYKLNPSGYCLTCNLISDDEGTELMARDGRSWRPVEFASTRRVECVNPFAG